VAGNFSALLRGWHSVRVLYGSAFFLFRSFGVGTLQGFVVRLGGVQGSESCVINFSGL
jgi:hypothetical protein